MHADSRPKHEKRLARGRKTTWRTESVESEILAEARRALTDGQKNRMDKNDATQRDRVLRAALEHRTELVAYARSLLGNYAAADDVLQEAMLVVVKKHTDFREGSSMIAWCRSIVRIEVLRWKQKQRRELTLAERLLDDAIDAAFEENQASRRRGDAERFREALRKCLEELPRRARDVLKGRFTDELTYLQIGDQLGMNTEAVRKILFRVKRRVRVCIETRLKATS